MMNTKIEIEDPLLRAGATAEFLATTEGRLANMRSAGIGPSFVKIGHSVRYRRSDVEAYVEANTVRPISA